MPKNGSTRRVGLAGALRWCAGAGAVVGLTLGGVAGPTSAGEMPDRPQFATGASELVPGQVIDVSGIGCPPDGHFDVDGPDLMVLFTPIDPPGNSLGFGIVDEMVISGLMTLAGVPGEDSASFTVDENGRWSGTLTIPDDVPTDREYKLVGLCLTLVEPVDPEGDPEDVDYERASFEVSPFTIQTPPAPQPPEATPPPAPPAPAVPSAPTFTG